MISLNWAHKYCRGDISKIENYDKAIADTTQTWHLHHRLELTLEGELALTREELIMHDMYYNRPYYELIFLTKAEHMRLHRIADGSVLKLLESARNCDHTGVNNSFYGKHHTESTKQKIRASLKGRHHSEVTRRKMSEHKKGKPLSDNNRLNKAKAQLEIGSKYRTYKANGGTMTYNEFRASIKKPR